MVDSGCRNVPGRESRTNRWHFLGRRGSRSRWQSGLQYLEGWADYLSGSVTQPSHTLWRQRVDRQARFCRDRDGQSCAGPNTFPNFTGRSCRRYLESNEESKTGDLHTFDLALDYAGNSAYSIVYFQKVVILILESGIV